VAGPDQRSSREGALRAVTLEAAYSLRLENEVGSIVPGKLANFTVLSENPITVPAATIKDIKVWGTVHEGRRLPVQHQDVGKSSLGPIANDATYKTMDLGAQAHDGQPHEGGDICMLTHRFAAALTKGY